MTEETTSLLPEAVRSMDTEELNRIRKKVLEELKSRRHPKFKNVFKDATDGVLNWGSNSLPVKFFKVSNASKRGNAKIVLTIENDVLETFLKTIQSEETAPIQAA